MCHEKEFREKISNEISTHLFLKMSEIYQLINSKIITCAQIYHYKRILDNQIELRSCYEEFLKNFELLDKKTIRDNGGMTYVNNREYIIKALTFWMGFADQLEFKTLSPVYYRNYNRSQLVGRMSKDLTTIEGSGALFTQRLITMIARFKKNMPIDYALTYLPNKKT